VAPVVRGSAGDWFGFDVAIDGERLLIGAPHARDASGRLTGAAYAVNLAAGAPGPPQLLSIPGGREGDEIGSSVAAAGGSWAVGARSDGAAGAGAGSVYVSRNGQLQKLLPDGPAAGGGFGQSVSLDGDRLAVGAPLDGAGGTNAGAAYLFAPGPAGWQGSRVPAAARPGSAFGYAVALAGDLLAVGAPLDGGQGREAGAAYLFVRQDDGTWLQRAQLAAAVEAGAQLGVAVACDRAGRGEVVAGARRAAGGAGAVYRFSSAGSPLGAVPAPSIPGSELGFALALRGGTLLAGAFLQDGGAGAVYLFAPAQGATVRLAAASVTVAESAGVLRLAVVVDTDDGRPPAAPVAVGIAALAGTALAGRDFRLLDDRVTIPAGARQGEARVAIVQDPLREPGESFTVALFDPLGADLGTPSMETITVRDDDRAGLVIALPRPPRLVTTDDGGSDGFTVALATQPSAPVLVGFAGAAGAGQISPPGPLLFTPASWNQPQRVTVSGVEAPPPRCLGRAPTSYRIALTTASADPRYAALSPPAAPAYFVPVVLRHDDRTTIAASLTACPQLDGTVFYTLVLVNQGECALDELPRTTLTDLLPWDDLALLAAVADQGTATVDPVANRVSWTGALAPGAQATIRIVAALQAGVLPGTPVVNQGSLTYPSRRGGPPDTTVLTDDPGRPGMQDPTVFLAGAIGLLCP